MLLAQEKDRKKISRRMKMGDHPCDEGNQQKECVFQSRLDRFQKGLETYLIM